MRTGDRPNNCRVLSRALAKCGRAGPPDETRPSATIRRPVRNYRPATRFDLADAGLVPTGLIAVTVNR